MIGPGSLPRLRPLSALKRRTLTYTPRLRARRTKRRPGAARTPDVRHPEIVLFDRARELPRATLIDHTPIACLRAWLLERWAWLAPRAVPVLVATVGMILVLISADYLAHFHGVPGAHYQLRIVGP